MKSKSTNPTPAVSGHNYSTTSPHIPPWIHEVSVCLQQLSLTVLSHLSSFKVYFCSLILLKKNIRSASELLFIIGCKNSSLSPDFLLIHLLKRPEFLPSRTLNWKPLADINHHGITIFVQLFKNPIVMLTLLIDFNQCKYLMSFVNCQFWRG